MVQLIGAGAFGALIGWYVYYINRYRTDKVQFSDLVTLIGILGGATVTTLFQEGTDSFGAYGIGLAIGFFAYFLVLGGFVWYSKNFDVDYFIDGRRTRPVEPSYIPDEWRRATGALDAGSGGGGGGGGNRGNSAPEVPSGRRTR